jgi:hypothetical protein
MLKGVDYNKKITDMLMLKGVDYNKKITDMLMLKGVDYMIAYLFLRE